jgi:transposase
MKDNPNQQGRPTKLTLELQNQICELLRWGNYIETVCAFVEVSKPTLYEWMKRGNREEKGIHRDFLNAVHKAMAEAEMRDVQNIFNAAKTDWKASAWRLERKFPKKWGRLERLSDDG